MKVQAIFCNFQPSCDEAEDEKWRLCRTHGSKWKMITKKQKKRKKLYCCSCSCVLHSPPPFPELLPNIPGIESAQSTCF